MDMNIIKMQLYILKKEASLLSRQGMDTSIIQAQIRQLDETIQLLEKCRNSKDDKQDS